MTELFLAELDREARGTRSALSRVPEGRSDWKPHEKSMALGYLAHLCATMPSWIEMVVNTDEFDMKPSNGGAPRPPQAQSRRQLAEALDASVAKARQALENTTDEHLLKPWRLLAGGHVVSEDPRHIVIRDAVFNHLAHHRGQLTVYLRLNGEPVPAIYGPSADEGK
ncbi:MAG TPA: DinB family protein [Terriglobales bacterium]